MDYGVKFIFLQNDLKTRKTISYIQYELPVSIESRTQQGILSNNSHFQELAEECERNAHI